MVKKQHSYTKRDYTKIIEANFLAVLDEYIPKMPGWEIAKKNHDKILRQFKVITKKPGVKAIVNVYRNGTIYFSCAPTVYESEFEEIIDLFGRFCSGVEKHLEKPEKERKKDGFNPPWIA